MSRSYFEKSWMQAKMTPFVDDPKGPIGFPKPGKQSPPLVVHEAGGAPATTASPVAQGAIPLLPPTVNPDPRAEDYIRMVMQAPNEMQFNPMGLEVSSEKGSIIFAAAPSGDIHILYVPPFSNEMPKALYMGCLVGETFGSMNEMVRAMGPGSTIPQVRRDLENPSKEPDVIPVHPEEDR